MGQSGDVFDAVAVHRQVVVEHVLGVTALLGQVLEEVQGHGRVVDLPTLGFEGEVVSVVEGPHQIEGLVGLLRWQVAGGDDPLQHRADLLLMEAAEIRVARFLRDIFHHVVAAGDVDQDHG